MLIGRHDDPESRAGVDVDVRIHATLTDQPQRAEPFEQWLADLRSLANQYQHLGIRETSGKCVEVLRVIVPHRYRVTVQLAEARERAERIEVVVQNRDLHGRGPLLVVCGEAVTMSRLTPNVNILRVPPAGGRAGPGA